MATLNEFPTPLDVQSLTVDEVIQRWRRHMKRPGGASGIQRASNLIYEARQRVGDTTALMEEKQDLQRLLEQYECILRNVREDRKRFPILAW